MARSNAGLEKVDVNLVPMIDIMFQLIAFFTMLINFDNTNRDERVRLPVADLAKPSEMKVEELWVLNINRHGQAVLLGDFVDVDDPQFLSYVRREADQALRAMKAARVPINLVDGRPQLWTTVLVRADQDVDYATIQRILRSCQEQGFSRFGLRATAEKAQ